MSLDSIKSTYSDNIKKRNKTKKKFQIKKFKISIFRKNVFKDRKISKAQR